VVDFDRDFHGFDANWLMVRPLGDGTLAHDRGPGSGQVERRAPGLRKLHRQRLRRQGKLRRDEEDDVRNLDPYLQLEWALGAGCSRGGLRHSRVSFDVDDRYLANGNDSGSVDYRHTTPLLGVLYKLAPSLNVYASAARGFETPTLNELFYSGTGAASISDSGPPPAPSWKPARKPCSARTCASTPPCSRCAPRRTGGRRLVGGRTSYRNASATLRQGLELSLDADLRAGFSARLAALSARDLRPGLHRRGRRQPPAGRAENQPVRRTGVEGCGRPFRRRARNRRQRQGVSGRRQRAAPAPGYAIVNARVQANQQLIGQLRGWRLREYARVNNLFDRTYIGSVIVGDSNKRYYEPAPGRNWVARHERPIPVLGRSLSS
jgi:iron complex outermembrane receptor protein